MKSLLVLLFALNIAIPTLAQHRQPIATNMDPNGRMISVDYLERDLLTPEPQHVSIQKQVVIDFQCVPSQPNPPSGNDRFYCDSATGQMVCKTSTGANCLAGGGGGGGSVTSVGLAGPTGIPITNSPCTDSCTLTWAMPSGWVLGDLLIGNGSNSVARLPAPTTPDLVTETLISTPSSGATLPQWGPAGLAGRVVSGTTDTIVATDRNPGSIEYTSNSPTAITVPDPASSGFNGNPSFVTIAEGAGPYTFTPQTSAVITYCDGSNCFAGQPTLTLQKGQFATWSSPTTSNWFVRVASTQPISNPPIVNGLISGGGVTWTGLLTFTCSAATYAIGGTVYNSPQTNLTLSAADPTNPRIDVIAVDNTGACVKITGTPAGSPAAPSVDPTSQLSLTFVTIAANATTPTLSSILVYDENSTPPTEYTCTPTANFNCNSTNNPFHLTKDIEATTAVATNGVSLVNNTTVNFSTYSTLSFNIRNKANWPSAKSLQICFLNSATIVGNCVGFKNGVFGFNQTNITSYQQIVIPLSAFALGSTVADRIRFQVIGGSGSIGFYLDWIQIQSTLSGNGGSNFQLQVNGQNTLQTANLANSASLTFAHVPGLNGVDVITGTVIGAPPSGTAGGALAGTYPNPTLANGTSCTNQVVTAISSSTAAGTCSTVANAMLANSATTPNGQTCTLGSTCNVNVGASAHSVAINQGNGAALTGVGPGSTTGKILQAVASADPAYNDFPDVKIIPAANCPNAVAGSGWSYATSTWTAACRAGTNNLGGALQLIPSTGGAAQFRFEIPTDWDSASQPYIRIEYGSGANTSGTVIWTVSSACTKADGSVTDDPSFVAESAFGTQTMAAASRAWSQTGQFTGITSGNNCVGGGGMIIKVALSGTAGSAINAYQAVVTTQRLPVVQAN